jgi:tetratricopeptide (TPR) repeat protein
MYTEYGAPTNRAWAILVKIIVLMLLLPLTLAAIAFAIDTAYRLSTAAVQSLATAETFTNALAVASHETVLRREGSRTHVVVEPSRDLVQRTFSALALSFFFALILSPFTWRVIRTPYGTGSWFPRTSAWLEEHPEVLSRLTTALLIWMIVGPFVLRHHHPPTLHVRATVAAPLDDQSRHYQLGRALWKSGRITEAQFEFREEVKLKPHSPSYDALAMIAADRHEWSDMIEYATRIIETDPHYDEGRGYYLRAWALVHSDRLFEAHNDANTACSLGSAQGCEFLKLYSAR